MSFLISHSMKHNSSDIYYGGQLNYRLYVLSNAASASPPSRTPSAHTRMYSISKGVRVACRRGDAGRAFLGEEGPAEGVRAAEVCIFAFPFSRRAFIGGGLFEGECVRSMRLSLGDEGPGVGARSGAVLVFSVAFPRCFLLGRALGSGEGDEFTDTASPGSSLLVHADFAETQPRHAPDWSTRCRRHCIFL